ncbi:hypothetical protein [Actinotalea solisilvae]|uniref:hypothetical protein n=1 Tax=Actinotalea solisilvae TaxID=2072922 RepID=UPI0018F124A1|nr:hypothetical protein [Actinotalea solisilvae]
MTAPPRRTRAAGALRWSGGLVGALVILATGAAAADHLTQRTTEAGHAYPAPAAVELVADGEVTVTAGGADVEVLARARTGLSPATYAADRTDAGLTVRHTCQDQVGASCSASLDVRVPEGTHVTVRASSGAVRVLDGVGDVTVSSGVGSVVVDGVGGRVRAAAGAGDVEVRGAGGPVEASTDIGDVAVHGASGEVVARSGSGGVEVRDAGGAVEATTGIGDVRVRGAAGDAVVRSGSGGLDVAGVLGDVRATTSVGRVVVRSTGDPVALDIATAQGRSTVDAPTDPGAPRSVYIRSDSGDVSYVGAPAAG